jgi:hypothetical protein
MISPRCRLPDRRFNETFEIVHDNQIFTVGIGRHDDGRIGEIFLDANKVGTAIATLARDLAILLSFLLQHNFPLELIRDAVTRRADGEAAGIVGTLLDMLAAEALPPLVIAPEGVTEIVFTDEGLS